MDPEVDINAWPYYWATSALATTGQACSGQRSEWMEECWMGNVDTCSESTLSCLKSSQPYWVQSLDSLTIRVTRDGWPRCPKSEA